MTDIVAFGLVAFGIMLVLVARAASAEHARAAERIEHEISALHNMLAERIPEGMVGKLPGGMVASGPSADYAWKARPIPVAVVQLNERGEWEPHK